MKKRNFFISVLVIFAFLLLISGCKKSEEKASGGISITMGSWRVDDVAQVKSLIAIFNQKYPNIKIDFKPTNPPEYNAVLRTQLQGGTAPDIFYVRSYSVTRELYKEGFIEELAGLPGLKENYTSDAAKPWSTDNGTPYAVPFMAVSHGIYYNENIFNKLNIEIPETWDELISVAKKIKDAGYVPFANGSKDEWDMNEIVFMNLAPSFIGGKEGREAYDKGERPFNDENTVSAFQALADIAPYLPKGQEAVSYYDSQQLFLQGTAAMFFGGSWDISMFESENVNFKWSVFAIPAPKGKKAVVCFHPDAGIALNKASKYKEEAKKFLEWLTSVEAATALGNEIPGFFSLNKNPLTLTNEHANAFLALNNGRELDVRWAWPVLLNGKPDGYTLMQNAALAVVKGKMTPQQAADSLQDGLAQWYEPAKKW